MQMIHVRTFPRLLASLSTLATLLLGIPSVSAAPTGQPPLPHASRVISLGPDNSTVMSGKVGGVIQPWLSDHEVLHFRHGQLYRYDAVAKTDTLLAGLTHQVKSSPCFLYFLSASPNGQQVVWGMSANNPIFVATMDGTRREQWDGDGGMTQPFWCADGKHWLQFHFGGSPTAIHFTKIERHSLEAPHNSKVFLTPPPGLNGLDILAAPSGDEVIACVPDHVDFQTPKPSKGVKQSDGSMALTFTDTPTLRRAQTISVWSLHQAQPLHRYAIDLPGNVQEVAVSPDGERAAWLLQCGAEKAGAASLWVSKLDGTGLRKLGNFRPGGKAAHGLGMDFPLQVVWVPGGKKISFTYGEALWTVPADQKHSMNEIKAETDTELIIAVRDGDLNRVELILTAGADPNEQTPTGWTALKEAAGWGNVLLINALLSSGAAVDLTDSDGWTAFRIAASDGHVNAMETLLSHGADMDAKDETGQTVLMQIAGEGQTSEDYHYQERHLMTLRFLIDHHANVNSADAQGMTVLMHAVHDWHLETVETLIAAEADVASQDEDGWTALHWIAATNYPDAVAVLVGNGASVDAREADGITPLMRASSGNNAETAEALLMRGSQIEARDTDGGWTPLIWAAAFDGVDTVRLLALRGANVDARDDDGRTALIVAAEEGQTGMVELLLSLGADSSIRDASGKTALESAVRNGHLEMQAVLQLSLSN